MSALGECPRCGGTTYNDGDDRRTCQDCPYEAQEATMTPTSAPQLSVIDVLSANGITFRAVHIPAGVEGPNAFRAPASSTRSTVEFYDTRHPHTVHGQFTGGYYYVETILDGSTAGLDLDSGIPDWTVDANAMGAVRRWLHALEGTCPKGYDGAHLVSSDGTCVHCDAQVDGGEDDCALANEDGSCDCADCTDADWTLVTGQERTTYGTLVEALDGWAEALDADGLVDPLRIFHGQDEEPVVDVVLHDTCTLHRVYFSKTGPCPCCEDEPDLDDPRQAALAVLETLVARDARGGQSLDGLQGGSGFLSEAERHALTTVLGVLA